MLSFLEKKNGECGWKLITLGRGVFMLNLVLKISPRKLCYQEWDHRVEGPSAPLTLRGWNTSRYIGSHHSQLHFRTQVWSCSHSTGTQCGYICIYAANFPSSTCASLSRAQPLWAWIPNLQNRDKDVPHPQREDVGFRKTTAGLGGPRGPVFIRWLNLSLLASMILPRSIQPWWRFLILLWF